jgi:ribonucleotide reductase class II
MPEFLSSAPSAEAVFYRTYSRRKADGTRENFKEAMTRCVDSIAEIGKFTKDQKELVLNQALKQHCFPSGRAFWVAGTEWLKDQKNFSGAYNCTSTIVDDIESFGLIMELAMMGSGTGAILEKKNIDKLPPLTTKINIDVITPVGLVEANKRKENSSLTEKKNGKWTLTVGDSRQGWKDAYQSVIELAASGKEKEVALSIDLSNVRPAGESLKGFGGTSNPVKLQEMFTKVVNLLNKAVGRKLTPIECCLLIDEAAACVVAGNVRRSAGMRQFSSNDNEAVNSKSGLYTQDENGNWRVDPEKEALRMANHTSCYHHKPTKEEIEESVRKQFYSGEGAIQYVPQAIMRANVDLLDTEESQKAFIDVYVSKREQAQALLVAQAHEKGIQLTERELEHRLGRYGLNPCFAPGTIVMTKDGYFPIEQLVGKSVEIHDGKEWRLIDNFRVTAYDQDVYDLELHDGTIITATEYHKFILADGTRKELKDLRPGDELMPANTDPVKGRVQAKGAYLKGFLVGDGTSDKGKGAACKVYAPKKVCLDRLTSSQQELEMIHERRANGRDVGETGLTASGYLKGLTATSEDLNPWCSVYKHQFPYEVLNWTDEAKAEFVAGLFDADGNSMDGTNGFAYQITSISRPFLQGLVNLLRTMGIGSKIGPTRAGGVKDFGLERGGIYRVKPTYRLTVSQSNSIKLANLCEFERLKDFSDRTTAFSLKTKANRVKSITFSHNAPEVFCCTVEKTHAFTLGTLLLVAQCGEITGADFHCNLAEIHLNTIKPNDFKAQEDAFRSGALQVAALLHHEFYHERYRYSREIDPIVGVSFTGLFDFFVNAFGYAWLEWMMKGRPNNAIGRKFTKFEANILSSWRKTVDKTVKEYCEAHGLRVPNRCTTVQPAGCLDADALRIFDQGLLFADELVDAGSGETTSLPLSVRDGIGATTAIANQPLDLVKLHFKNGRTLRMTPDHRLSINGKWVRADQMKTGMIVDHAIGMYRKEENSFLLPVSDCAYTREARIAERGSARGAVAVAVKTPASVDEDLAYFIGALYGNGCMDRKKSRIRFTHGDMAILDRIKNTGERLFGISGNVSTSDGKAPELTFASVRLFDWLVLNRLGKTEKSANLSRIPESIRRSSRKVILSFFAGLIDTDGCARNDSFSIDMSSENFLRHLQQVGEAVGLCFGLSHNVRGENMQTEKSIWSLHLSRMKSDFGSFEILNGMSSKLKNHPVKPAKREFKYEPYEITEIVFEEGIPDYSYDFAVEGIDDDDSWYWQGALKSHNTKSLLTGASPGWHPPKAQRFIRRITFGKADPLVSALRDWGYNVIPAQSARDENGNLLDDIMDERVQEVLVEIPTEVPWANIEGCDKFDLSKLPAEAQWRLYMQVQQYYTAHNTSATIEFRENEISILASLIHESIKDDTGYISAALLARFDANETFPRLPFEPIDNETFVRLNSVAESYRSVLPQILGSEEVSFLDVLNQYDKSDYELKGAAGCDSDKCLAEAAKDSDQVGQQI